VSTPFPQTTLAAGQLRELGESDLGDLQALFERCEDYFLLHEARPPTETEGRDEWDEVPEATPRDHKHILGLFAPELTGVVEVVRDWPRAGTWNIGLLLLDPATRGRGAGTELVGVVDARALAGGAATLRISVDPANADGLRFWERHGFTPVPAVGDHPTAMALERPVAGAR
jgi:GNAT superfamily N-acetyltransferase